jgi:hypothetical protein
MVQTSGYLILRRPKALVAAYDLSMRKHQASKFFQRLCETLNPLPRSAYRGISRYPLKPLPSMDAQILLTFEQSGCDVWTGCCARRRFLEMLGDQIPESDFDEDLLPNNAAAREIFSLLESPHEYELVYVAREPFCDDADCLGFDVGYWGGDHYSIICDSAVRPIWHPPQPECFDELARQQRAFFVSECRRCHWFSLLLPHAILGRNGISSGRVLHHSVEYTRIVKRAATLPFRLEAEARRREA